MKNEDNEIRHEFLWQTHNYITEHIRFADAKAGMVIGWTSAIIAALFALKIHKDIFCTIQGAISILVLLILMGSGICAFLVIIPRFNSTQSEGFIFWRSIRKHYKKETYTKEFLKLKEQGFTEEILGHNYDLSGVCERKFLFVNWSMRLAGLGSIIAAFVVFFR